MKFLYEAREILFALSSVSIEPVREEMLSQALEAAYFQGMRDAAPAKEAPAYKETEEEEKSLNPW